MEENKNPFEGSYDQPWDKNNIQWRRAKAMYASWGIEIEELEDNKVKVTQARFDKNLFNQKELVHRGRSLYPDKKYKVVANTFSFQADSINHEWIREQMQRYELKPKDLVHQLGIRSSNISELINGVRPLSAPVSALFYYYFQVQRLTREMRGATDEEVAEAFAEALRNIRERKAQEAQQASPE